MELSKLIKEVKYRTARSSGSGGQHVNKVETKVELLFDIAKSNALSEEEKSLLSDKAVKKINKNGMISVVSQEKRTQLLNKERALRKFLKLIDKALTPAKKRKYKPIKANKEARLDKKRRQSEKKQNRKKLIPLS